MTSLEDTQTDFQNLTQRNDLKLFQIKSGEDLEIDQYTNRVRRASSMMFGEKLPRIQERMTSAHDETVNYIPERKSRSRSYSLS